MHKVAPCFLYQISVRNLKSVAFAPQILLKSVSLNGIILLKSVKNYTENLLKSGIGMLYRKIETVIEEHIKSDSKKILLQNI